MPPAAAASQPSCSGSCRSIPSCISVSLSHAPRAIENDEFLEYEEVYQDRFYGTLKSQVERQCEAGQNVVFDVDVKGGINIKRYYGERAMSLFIQPPSIDELRRRLVGRATDTPEAIEERLAKAEYELGFAPVPGGAAGAARRPGPGHRLSDGPELSARLRTYRLYRHGDLLFPSL